MESFKLKKPIPAKARFKNQEKAYDVTLGSFSISPMEDIFWLEGRVLIYSPTEALLGKTFSLKFKTNREEIEVYKCIIVREDLFWMSEVLVSNAIFEQKAVRAIEKEKSLSSYPGWKKRMALFTYNLRYTKPNEFARRAERVKQLAKKKDS